MTSYCIEKFKCESCEGFFSSWATASYNTFGATFFTDGKVEGPTFDPGNRLVRCPHCSAVNWHDKFLSLGYQYDSESSGSEGERRPVWAGQVSTADIRKAVENSLARNSEEEIYLRLQVWWADNDHIRNAPDEYKSWSMGERENLERLRSLLEILPESDPTMRAEICRELGDFAKCIELLAAVPEPQKTPMMRLIAELAGRSVSTVGSLPVERPARGGVNSLL